MHFHISQVKRPLLAVAICTALPSCKLARTSDFDPAGDPAIAAAASASASTHLPFIELDRDLLPDRKTLVPDGKPYRLRPGDGLELEVAGHPESLGRSIVLPDGMLYYDVAEGVRAGGETIAEVERELSKQLVGNYAAPIVSANLYDVQGSRYTILGQVRQPGTYPLSAPTTLLNAIASAGGLSSGNIAGKTRDLSDLGRSVVVRDGRLMPVNFEKLIRAGDMRHNIYLQAGDYIFMPASGTEKVYVLGSVANPTTVPYSSDLTLVSAIASARGLQQGAFANGVVLIRGSFHEPKLAGVDLRDVLRGKAKNFRLQPGDIIWVPRRPWYKLEEYAKLAITSIATSVALNEAYKIFEDEDDDDDSRNTVNVNVGGSPAPTTTTTNEVFVPVPASEP